MIYIKKKKSRKKIDIKTERRGGGGAVISQEPLRQASSRECGSRRGTPSGFCSSGFLRHWHPPARPWHPLLLASTRSTLAALHTPSLGSNWAPVCLPWEPTVRLPGPGPSPQAAPMLFKGDFLLAGPGEGAGSRLGAGVRSLEATLQVKDSGLSCGLLGSAETPPQLAGGTTGPRMLVTRISAAFLQRQHRLPPYSLARDRFHPGT